MNHKINKLKFFNFVILVMVIAISYSLISIMDAHASCVENVGCGLRYVSSNGSPSIIISRDAFSTGSKVDILIHAPDFNSNSYALDTIGEEGSKVIVSTRESSIPYRLVETGFDTGDFEGYVILSSTTSACSPICGPTDGYLAASGDDAITVSLVYPDGSTVTNTSFDTQTKTGKIIPEFPFAEIVLVLSMISLLFFSRRTK